LVRTVIFGSRPDGHARVVIELLAPVAGLLVEGLIDDFPRNADRRIGDLGVIGTSADLPKLVREGVQAAILGFGHGRGRSAIAATLRAAGLELPTLVHPAAHVATSAVLGPGAQVLPGAVVGPGAVLGTGVLLNTAAIAEHDVRLSDGVVVFSGAVLAGRVVVGSDAEVGAGATVLPDVRIGSRAVVGAGATVIGDVDDALTVVGVPARPIRRPA
jgi:sugar O-acyltransferase (sialic acid O-acetyltransferase NeuD family)